ncbi:hypothetical protein [Rhodococcus sp. NPDC049939]|uniref:hypothetical protein n=1 Tax=Rhodococcus sp. NPDC049939 TaxID=3155511 RepID=UPI0033E0158B
MKIGASYGVFAMIAVVCVITAWLSIIDGDYAAMKYFVGILGFLGLAIGFSVSYQPKSHQKLEIRERVVRGETVPSISYSTTPTVTLCLIMGLLGLLLAFASYDLRPQTVSEDLGGTVFFGLAAFFFWSLPLSFLIGRLAFGYIAFTSQGILQRGWAFESFLPWGSVAGALAGYNGYPTTVIVGYSNAPYEKKRTALFWRIDSPAPIPALEIDYRQMADDPTLVHEFVMNTITEKTGR